MMRRLRPLRKSFVDENSDYKRFIPGFINRTKSRLHKTVLLPVDTAWGTSMNSLNRLSAGLSQFGNLTFSKNFASVPVGIADNVDADYSAGSKVSTVTAVRGPSNPATYIDEDGRIQVTQASNKARITAGFYDTTGFVSRPGILIEEAGKNLLVRTDGSSNDGTLWTGWADAGNAPVQTYSNVPVPELSAIPGATSQRVQVVVGQNQLNYLYSDVSAAGSVAQNNKITLSFWARSQNGFTGGASADYNIGIQNSSGADVQTFDALFSGITSSWKRFSFTHTVTHAGANKLYMAMFVYGVTAGTGDLEIYGVQIEVKPYATSWIPTTTAALTRNYDHLTYPTEVGQSVFFKFSTEAATTSMTISLIDTDNGDGWMWSGFYDDGGIIWDWSSNGSAGNMTIYGTFPGQNVSVVGAFVRQTPSPYATMYQNGVSVGVDTDSPNGSSFDLGPITIGGSSDTTEHIDGIIQSVAIFSDAKNATDVLSISNLMNDGLVTYNSPQLIQTDIPEEMKRDVDYVKLIFNHTGNVRYFVSTDGVNYPVEVLVSDAIYKLYTSEQTKFNDLRIRVVLDGDASVENLKIIYSVK